MVAVINPLTLGDPLDPKASVFGPFAVHDSAAAYVILYTFHTYRNPS